MPRVNYTLNLVKKKLNWHNSNYFKRARKIADAGVNDGLIKLSEPTQKSKLSLCSQKIFPVGVSTILCKNDVVRNGGNAVRKTNKMRHLSMSCMKGSESAQSRQVHDITNKNIITRTSFKKLNLVLLFISSSSSIWIDS